MASLQKTDSRLHTLDTELWASKSRVGLIDVGSNTVRFVVFDLNGRLPQLVFNERAFCGLGAHLATTGKISRHSAKVARQTIHRFNSLAKQMQVSQLDIFATAAVREAKNGQSFVDGVHRDTGKRMRILAGEEEAHHSAFGVLAGIPGATGIAGDLGGGSLELAALNRGRVGHKVSLPLGTLRLLDAFGGNLKKAAMHVDEVLADIEWLDDHFGSILYSVGGTWRALAKYRMIQTDYPLRILHQYESPGKPMRSFAKKVAKENDPATAAQLGISPKRSRTLPVAAMVMDRVIRRLQPDQVVVSALGLREGILYGSAPSELRKKDPLIEFCRDIARRQSRFPAHGADLRRWISPLFPEDEGYDPRLIKAACILSDIGWTGHPEYRAEFAKDQIMQRQITGITHMERAFIGLCLFVTHGGSLASADAYRTMSLLKRRQRRRAQQIGLAIRLAQRISGGTKKLLGRCSIRVSEQFVILDVPQRFDYLIGESVRTRLKLLARAMNRKPRIEIKKEMAEV